MGQGLARMSFCHQSYWGHEVVSQPRDITYAKQLPHENALSVEKNLLPVTQEPPKRAPSPSKCKCFCTHAYSFAPTWDTGDPEWSRREMALLRDAGGNTTPMLGADCHRCAHVQSLSFRMKSSVQRTASPLPGLSGQGGADGGHQDVPVAASDRGTSQKSCGLGDTFEEGDGNIRAGENS